MEAYPDTPWSLIVQAGGDEQTQRELFRVLLQQYWQPVHAVLRKHSQLDDAAAERAMRHFFSVVVTSDWLAGINPEQGRFRDLLRERLMTYLSSGQELENPESTPAEQWELAESVPLPESEGDAETVFDEQWILLLFHRASDKLRRAAPAPAAQAFHMVDVDAIATETTLPEALSMSKAEASAWLRQGRQWFRSLIIAEVKQYVTDDAAEREEVRWLLH